jgi:pyrroline-5-carboxylate reductase
MAGAMVEGWRSAGIDFSAAVAIRPSGRPVEGVRTVSSLAEAGPPPRLVMLGFKPQMLDQVTPELIPWLSSRTVLVSILAGVEAASLRKRFAKPAAIVRAMPNLPVSVRRGVVALYSEDADEAVRGQLSPLFSALGTALWTSGEAQFGAIGAVAGAGPAYVARFVAALAKAGERLGMNREIADMLALETMFGTAWMAAAREEPMNELARRVASPSGTTEAGLAVLDSDGALDRLIAETIEAASRRGAELAAASREPASS